MFFKQRCFVQGKLGFYLCLKFLKPRKRWTGWTMFNELSQIPLEDMTIWELLFHPKRTKAFIGQGFFIVHGK